MPNIIFNLEYRYTQYSKKNLNLKEQKLRINTKEMYDYYNRDEACDKTIQTEQAFNYYNYRVGSQGGFNDTGYKDEKDCQKEVDEYQPEVIYRSVVSFDKKFAMETGIMEKKKMEILIKKSMPGLLMQMQFNPDNMVWTAFYHTNTEHPHCHIAFYEKVQTRKLHRINKKHLEKVRSHFVKQLELNTKLYIKKDQVFKELMDTIQQCGLNEKSKEDLYSSFNNAIKTDDSLKSVALKMKQLNNVLPDTGSMKYNSKNIRPFHPQIKEIIQDILKLDSVKPFYDEYLKMLDEIKSMQMQLYGNGVDEYVSEDQEMIHGVANDLQRQEKYYQDRLKSLEIRIGNLILQNILCAREDFKNGMRYESNPIETNNQTIYPHEKSEQFDRKEVRHEDIKITSHTEKGDVSSFQKSKNFRIRSNNISHRVIQELSYEINEIFYATSHDKQMIQEVTQNARREIYARTI